MGEIFRIRNLRVCIYPKDHLPAHLHVLGPGAEAKFEIEHMECFFSRGFKKSTLNEIKAILLNEKKLLMEVWNENQ